MFASLRALLTGLIDYAGLFPPAGLPLDQAIRNYARYQQEPESWMLARFICPAKQLEELAPFVEELFDSKRPLQLSTLGPPADGHFEEDMAVIVSTVEAMRDFCERQESRVVGNMVEFRLVGNKRLRPFFIAQNLGRGSRFFFELGLGDKWRDGLANLATATQLTLPLAGLKLRCGGLHASTFPTPEQVAYTIAACRDAKIPLKFTAGLHHPIRHYSAEVQTQMHGFINVFVAGVLAHARGLNEDQLRLIIEDEDASDFRFDDEGFGWKDYRASTEEIVRARQSAVTSFGSCSFDEPRDDLRKLGWMR